jgi:hypothetical protein
MKFQNTEKIARKMFKGTFQKQQLTDFQDLMQDGYWKLLGF